MTEPHRSWNSFYDECDDAVSTANKRASSLTSFGIGLVVLAVVTIVVYVVAVADGGGQSANIALWLPLTIGTVVSLLVVAAALFGLASLVDIAGKDLALRLRTERTTHHDHSTPNPPPETAPDNARGT